MALGCCLMLSDCSEKPKKKDNNTLPVEETLNTVACDSVETATAVESIAPLMSTLQGNWSEPSGDQHNLSLKSDGTFEYQDFEKTKNGDLIDVMRKGTYTIDGDKVRLKGDDGWELVLSYNMTDLLDEQHLTAGNNLDLVKE